MKNMKQLNHIMLRDIGQVYIDLPETCPHCSKMICPKIESISKLSTFTNKFALLLSCPSCEEFFIQLYNYIDDGTKYGEMIPYQITPNIDINLPNEIQNISPEFVEIYKQSLLAEFYNLNKIAGMGFRKSIEFLVKDYLINFLKKDESIIKKSMLGVAINQIDNPKIKTLAKAATWLGNDETHYERRYENKDINDMKKFIKTLAHFISFELVAIEASEFTDSSIAR